MPDLAAIAYVSSAARPYLESDLERLLLDARQRNEAEQVTGVLLYDDGTFFQYIEGPTDGIERIYQRIKSSEEHVGLIQLFRRPIVERNFDGWTMGFSRAPKSVLLGLSQAAWEATVDASKGKENPGGGIRLLLEFWSKASRRP